MPVLNQLRLALRSLRNNRGFTAIAVLTVALGVGANTTIFSLLNTVMFRPLPYPDPDRLAALFRTSPQSQSWPHSVANFLDQRQQNTVFERLAAFTWQRFNLAEAGEPAESLRGIAATADFFPALGASAALGRTFTAEEDQPGRDQVIVLSHSFWVRRFAADPNIIGRRLRINGEKVAVIGVMPAAVEYPQLWGPLDAWRPLTFSPDQRQDRRNNWLQALGRLKPGVSVPAANAAMRSLASRLEQTYPEANAHNNLRVAPLRESIGDRASRRFAWLLLGLTGFVLLIACVNLANLQLARAASRSRELAVRLALGAGRWRLMWQLLVESLIVALLGGAAGIVLAIWAGNFLGSRLTIGDEHGLPVTLDWRVLLFALLASILTGVLFGVAPAWLASRTDLNGVLKAQARGTTAGRSQHRLRQALIVGEFALALVLLTGAGLFIGGLHRFMRQDPGWRVDGLLTGWLRLDSSKYPSPDQWRSFVERLDERLAAIPGVAQTAVSSSLPIWAFGASRGFVIEGQPAPALGQAPLVHTEAVTPRYFETFGIALRQGRFFSSTDTTNRPDVVIINEAMARQFWPGASPIGKRIGGTDQADPGWQEIVGVVNDIRFPANLGRPDTLWQIYCPIAQDPRPYVAVELRTSGPPEKMAPALHAAVADLDPDLPVNELGSARQHVDRLLANFRLAGGLLGAFAVLGLVLAALGVYGVISHFVAQRTGEIGVRMALGAQTRDVTWMVLRQGVVLSFLGIAVGLAGAVLVVSLLEAAVPELPANDPKTFVAIVGALLLVALFACWWPARRASKVDPLAALRYE